MRIKAKTENENIASAYVAEMSDGKLIEFVESVQPPIPREEKWVLIITTLYGCPVNCKFCDAGGNYRGKLTYEDIISQIDYLIRKRFPDGSVPVPKFKIQFARMGEPALNDAVLDVLRNLPALYNAPGLLPTVSTIAPKGAACFFEKLLDIKNTLYRERFLLQFSVHTTDREKRDWLIPAAKWDFSQIADYGEKFYRKGERKITLNFALAENMPVTSDILLNYFNPEKYLIKVTPVNPTYKAQSNKIKSSILPEREKYKKIEEFKTAGYEVILSIGEWEENLIGSNCGQHIINYLSKKQPILEAYTYPLREV